MMSLGILRATRELGAVYSRIWSIGRTPSTVKSAVVAANCGKTRPGQSQRSTSGDRRIVWKCFVLPGVAETDTFFSPTKALMVEDLPTLGYPTRPTVKVGASAAQGHISFPFFAAVRAVRTSVLVSVRLGRRRTHEEVLELEHAQDSRGLVLFFLSRLALISVVIDAVLDVVLDVALARKSARLPLPQSVTIRTESESSGGLSPASARAR